MAMANVLLGIHCVVPGCGNTLKKVNQWKARKCSKPQHEGKTHAQCMCPDPFQFFKFPSEIKLQKIWLERVNNPDLEINNLTRVCSDHFVEGRPTRRHYFPDLSLRVKTEVRETNEDELEAFDEPEETLETIIAEGGNDDQSKEDEDAISIVPMEYLQGNGEDGVDEDDDDIEELFVSGDNNTNTSSGNGNDNIGKRKLVISRVGQGNNFNATPTPQPVRNSVTITKVQSPNKVVTPIQRITTNTSGSGKPNNDPLRPHSMNGSKDEDSDCPFEIEVLGEDDDDDDGESSDLSDDLGIVNSVGLVKTTTPTVIQVTSKANVPKPTYVVVTRNITNGQPSVQTVPANSANSNSTKPRLVPPPHSNPRPPVPGTSAKIANGSLPFKPIITKVNTTTAVRRPIPSTSNSVGINGNGVPRTPNPTAVVATNGSNGSALQNPVARYDPNRQQLQIANPVKYIQDCHNRIAELLAEIQKKDAKIKELDRENQELRKTVNSLKNTPAVSMPHFSTPTFNLIPSLTQGVGFGLNNGGNVTVNSNGSSNNITSSVAPSPTTPRIRYVIRRQN